MEFQRWCILKGKIFDQESTYLKDNFSLKKFSWFLTLKILLFRTHHLWNSTTELILMYIVHNCFELPSDWLVSYWESQSEGSSKQLLIKSRYLGVSGFYLLNFFTCKLNTADVYLKGKIICIDAGLVQRVVKIQIIF